MVDNELNWPSIELCNVKDGILSQFTANASEIVANVLIKELVEKIDCPPTSDATNTDIFSNDQDLDWVMQVVNHGFTLPFYSSQAHETLKGAIRIYLAWSSALTLNPHPYCPKPILLHPDRYFRKILEAFRHVFLERKPLASDLNISLSRHGTQIHVILTAIRQLSSNVVDDYKDEIWSRLLIFLISIVDQLMSVENCKAQESIGYLMNSELSQTLFDCWLQAALCEFIPSPSFWTTLSELTWRCIFHAPLIECWARALLRSSSLLFQLLNGCVSTNLNFDERIFEPMLTNVITPEKIQTLKTVWINLFNLLGNPAHFTRYALSVLEEKQLDPADFVFFSQQTSLSFFLAIMAMKKLVDMLIGEDFISIDFAENDEFYSQVVETSLSRKRHIEASQNGQRISNMSSASNQPHSIPSTPVPNLVSIQKNFNEFSYELGSANVTENIQAGQHVWYILRNNQLKPLRPVIKTNTGYLLSIFLDWLFEPSLFYLNNNSIHSQQRHAVFDDALSQKSAESDSLADAAGVERQTHKVTILSQSQQRREFVALRSSFANSTSNSSASNFEPAMVGDPRSQQKISTIEFPSADGIGSGRATALGTLCRIICSKSSKEVLSNEHLAQFFVIAHEALLSRDRLMLCSLIFHTADDLFKLGLNGVQILLPNYLMALDIVHTESMKLTLHPSIDQTEMRASCLRALASILNWPSVFGSTSILDRKFSSVKSTRADRRRSSTNLLETESLYTDIRTRIQRMLIYSLRNELDPHNLQLTLALSSILCIESARYDMKKNTDDTVCGNGQSEVNSQTLFSISLIKSIVSAICDNIYKPSWANEIICCLAAYDCLNSLSSIPHQILYFKGELSIGSLVVTSLCRFIDQQMQRPPPSHSRDMHSTIVAAYYCIGVWLNSAPTLAEVEPCLNTVAQTIELGMTGGHNLNPNQYRPASQRVHDAAERLLHSLFSKGRETKKNFIEFELAQKFNLKLDHFQHFLIGQSTLLSLYDVQQMHHWSAGLPTVIAIFRTPFNESWTSLIQLKPKAFESRKRDDMSVAISVLHSVDSNNHSAQSPGCTSVNALVISDTEKRRSLEMQENIDSNNYCQEEIIKQFEIPSEVFQSQCKLDTQFPKLEPASKQVQDIQAQLTQIGDRLAQGSGAPIGDRDSRNIWLSTSLGAVLSQPPTPLGSSAYCNSLRVFLYDMGVLNRQAFGKDFIPLDSSSYDIFYDSLSQTVDLHPVSLNQTVFVFYMRDGQRVAEDILQNNINLKHTSPQFCRFLCDLGKPVETRPHGHPQNGSDFVLDGVDFCLRWRDAQVEMTFVTPTGRTPIGVKNSLDATALLQPQQPQRRTSGRRTGTIEQQGQPYSSKTRSGTITNSNVNKADEVMDKPMGTAQINVELNKSTRTMSCASGSECASNAETTTSTKHQVKRSADQRIFIVWLERLEDMECFPTEDMFMFTSADRPNDQLPQQSLRSSAPVPPQIDHIIFFLYPFEKGLVRIQMEGIWTKYGQPGPLLNGTVASMTALPSLIHQTICSIARRKTVELDNYQMNHLRRKHAIAEFGRRFETRQDYAEFIEHFIADPFSSTPRQ